MSEQPKLRKVIVSLLDVQGDDAQVFITDFMRKYSVSDEDNVTVQSAFAMFNTQLLLKFHRLHALPGLGEMAAEEAKPEIH